MENNMYMHMENNMFSRGKTRDKYRLWSNILVLHVCTIVLYILKGIQEYDGIEINKW